MDGLTDHERDLVQAALRRGTEQPVGFVDNALREVFGEGDDPEGLALARAISWVELRIPTETREAYLRSMNLRIAGDAVMAVKRTPDV